jgi:hypothetical protein
MPRDATRRHEMEMQAGKSESSHHEMPNESFKLRPMKLIQNICFASDDNQNINRQPQKISAEDNNNEVGLFHCHCCSRRIGEQEQEQEQELGEEEDEEEEEEDREEKGDCEEDAGDDQEIIEDAEDAEVKIEPKLEGFDLNPCSGLMKSKFINLDVMKNVKRWATRQQETPALTQRKQAKKINVVPNTLRAIMRLKVPRKSKYQSVADLMKNLEDKKANKPHHGIFFDANRRAVLTSAMSELKEIAGKYVKWSQFEELYPTVLHKIGTVNVNKEQLKTFIKNDFQKKKK